MSRKTYIDAFFDGYKPAVWLDEREKGFASVAERNYTRLKYDDHQYLFFQNERERQAYIDREGSVGKIYNMGITLGFPERSVAFYVECKAIEEQIGELPYRDVELGMIWAGFFFSTHLDLVHGETRWLWDTYKHPKAIENPLYLWARETSYVEVSYGDFEQLEAARQYIMQQRVLVPAAANE